jgi:hypothetical protein
MTKKQSVWPKGQLLVAIYTLETSLWNMVQLITEREEDLIFFTKDEGTFQSDFFKVRVSDLDILMDILHLIPCTEVRVLMSYEQLSSLVSTLAIRQVQLWGATLWTR